MLIKKQDRASRFETERVVCTMPVPDDLPEFAEMHRNLDVMATLGGKAWTDAESAMVMGRFSAHWQAHGFGPWIMREKESGAFVGRAGLRHVIADGQPEIELLYATMPTFWRMGYTSEAAIEMIRIGFENFGLESIVAFTLPTNIASQGVMKRAGLRYEKNIDWNGYESVFYRVKAQNQ